jgi:hypothetical protein
MTTTPTEPNPGGSHPESSDRQADVLVRLFMKHGDRLACCVMCGVVVVVDIVALDPVAVLTRKKLASERTPIFRGKPCVFCLRYRPSEMSEYRTLDIRKGGG